jgi:hypothetical protein
VAFNAQVRNTVWAPHPFWIPPRHGSHQVQNKRRECDLIDNVSPPQQHELSFPILDLSHKVSWFGLYRLGSECNDLTRLYAWAHPCTICATRLLDKEFDLAIGGLLVLALVGPALF